MSPRKAFPVLIALVALGLQGCVATVVGATAGAVVGVGAAAVVTTAKVGGAVVGAVVPGGDKKDGKKSRNR